MKHSGNTQFVTVLMKKAPVITVLEKVHSLKDGGKTIPESPHPAAKATSEQSMECCGTVHLLFCYVLYSLFLTEESERKYNNSIALEVKEYAAKLQMLIKPKYRYKAIGFRGSGKCGKFHTLMPRRTELPWLTCSPSEMLHLFFVYRNCLEIYFFFHITCSLNISTGDNMC